MLRNIRKPLGLAIILTILTILLPASLLAAPVGKISHLEGEVDVTPPDGKTAIVKLADPVSVGDILRTKAKSKVEVTFPDGNTLFLAERSRLRISEYENKEDSKNHFDLFRGKTRVVVNNLAKKSAIELHTPTAVAGVRGTIWIGSFENGVSEFYFERGVGYGYNKSMPEVVVTIRAGQIMKVISPDQPPAVRPATADEINRQQTDTTSTPPGEQMREPSATAPGPVAPPPSVLSSMTSVLPLPTVQPPTPSTEPITQPPSTTKFSGAAEPGGVISGTVDMTIDNNTRKGSISLSGNLGQALPLTGSWVISGPLGLKTDSGEISGFLTASSGSWEGLMTGVYSAGSELGYLTTFEPLRGEATPGSTSLAGSGTIGKTKIEDNTGGALSFTLLNNSQTFTQSLANEYPDGPTIFIETEQIRNASLAGRNWGVWQAFTGGTYSFIPGADAVNASWTIDHNFPDYSDTSYLVSATTWDAVKNTFFGQSSLAVANWGAAKTAVGSGTIMGSFDPVTSAWTAADTGAWIETGRFLSMAADPVYGVPALQALNIPSFLVGKATLRQVDPATPVNNLTNIAMNNITFFAPSTGLAPSIWATDSVTGNYNPSVAPAAGGPLVSLVSDTGDLSADFGIRNWNAGIWGANIDGGGILNSGIYSSDISFSGGATGQFAAGSFSSGTAAGTAVSFGAPYIPPYIVGATDLRGSWTYSSNSVNLGISNATFFAPTSGATAQYWASSEGVSGTYTGTPTPVDSLPYPSNQTSFPLAGYLPGTQTQNGIAAAFNLLYWADSVWGATITDGNVPSGTTGFSAEGFQFDGAAGGQFGGGSLSGTAAGEVISSADITAPVLSFIDAPSTVTNQSSASFNVASSEAVTYSYSIDGGAYTSLSSGTFSLSNLSDGAHTLTVLGADAAGNSATISYSWTVATVAPTGSLTSLPGKVTGLDTADFAFTTDAGNTRYYRLDNGSWQVFNDAPLTSLPEGKRTIDFKAVDPAGKESDLYSYEWFIGKRQYVLRDAQGGVTGGVAGDLTGRVSASSEGIRAISTGTTGSWLIDMAGNYQTMPTSVNLTASGKGYGPYTPTDTVPTDFTSLSPSGYWLSRITAGVSAGSMTGTSALTYLSATTLGTGNGAVTGSIGSGLWQAQDLGLGTYTETPLAFGGQDSGSGNYFWKYGSSLLSGGSLEGLIGGATTLFGSLGTNMSYPAVDVKGLGIYANASNYPLFVSRFDGQNLRNAAGAPDSTPNGYALFFGGVATQTALSGRMHGLYRKNTGGSAYELGLLSSDGGANAALYPELSPPMWTLTDGTRLQAYRMSDNITSAPAISSSGFVSGSDVVTTLEIIGWNGGAWNEHATYTNEMNFDITQLGWNVEAALAGGTYSGGTPGAGAILIQSRDSGGGFLAYTRTEIGSVSPANVFDATIVGADHYGDIDWTAVGGGTVKGLFDPATSTWQAASLFTAMETAQFMNKVSGMTDAERTAFYKAANIPAFNVGATDLRGSYLDSVDVEINKATFFAPASGARPQIWASGGSGGGVSGTYTASPNNATVPLTGYQPGTETTNGISANFNFQQWGASVGGKWSATVTDGSGTVGGHNVKFLGVAGGTIVSTPQAGATLIPGNFSGTAAGIVAGTPTTTNVNINVIFQ